MKIFLVRHGQTDWNLEKRIQGREDIELNKNGINQAKEVGRYLRNSNIKYIVSSPLIRARKTAEIIGCEIGLNEITIEKDLIERDYGGISGLFFDEMRKILNENIDMKQEDINVVKERMLSVVQKYSKKKDNVLMVSHGAAINSFLALLSNGEIGSGKTKLKNACINVFDCEDDNITIERYNISAE